MTTVFPGALDDFTNPTSGTQLSATGLKHHDAHSNLNDAVEAIEAYLGKTGSAVTGSITYQVNNLTTIVGTGTTGGVTDAQYLTLATHTGLTVERTLAISGTLSGTDNGAGQTFVVRDLVTGVSSGTFYRPTITVNSYGKVTFASDTGAGDGFVRGAPTQPRFVTSFWFGDYVSTYDKVYFNTKVATGSLYYIDRSTDLPVLIGPVSGKTPGVMIYSTILTGFVMSHSTSSGFYCAITGGTAVGVTLGMDGGACIRTTVSGKTIYTNALGNARVEIFDPASAAVTNTLALGAGGTDGRSLCFVSGNDSAYLFNRSGDLIKIYCPTTGTVTVTGGIGTLASRSSCSYNLAANRVFCCGGNSSSKIAYFTPAAGSGTESISTLSYPSSYVSDGSYVAFSNGNFVYFTSNSNTPSIALVLDAVNLTWKTLGFSENVANTTSLDRGSFMAGVPAEGVLYFGCSFNTSVGFVTYGRY